ncbi:E3 ubiquitin-protein ligase HRD1-like [Limulus polyphemus]|uniref:E3 ubiquitin-protein ligase HRD1-like n=1 Tax=Limulus polyphemus TaxID=6850 RepID=A0ABM1TJH6_LIMPO|nr:E3 ubiquitin-protein ligase HRD1-like [Limulus polyphemus]XP_013787790.1 E3 ubiquitin-protein ligase HRD1-like [Limulus polyphemus]XP_022256027.1 E3 ubiquitin-protein ligase HRD1-like [Limulus polyphemus]XP_022256028.1 E3 ubiquitin-protein ligase HRD1-like [Limulus polyphemus]XP_022256029.1 E3 ubiquitin-protein ligase HRD1-like [Limulus polyphemus]XP_022256030.1 E3 ubiquitin-protein ligase HRD1-like [Limulus polyphemus]XP_022256031.1 E3 ubiquitin-protein ligase HRD1-like [Limulus polyphemu
MTSTSYRMDSLGRRSETVSCLVNQVIFFMLCDRWFCPKERLTGLYSLLFYNVFCYLITYARRLLDFHNYSPIVRMSEHTNIRHLSLTATKIILDLTKAITFVITGVFMLLVFGLEQGLEHFSPTWWYIMVTTMYFLLTERACQQRAPTVLSWMQLDMLENLEPLWCPVLLRFLSSFASGLMITVVLLCTDGGWMLILAASYINVFLGIRDLEKHWKLLLQERACLDKYRYATRKELTERDDVCAVCLQAMMCARVTPCRHMFHGDCLRRCLKERTTCPLCKQEL